MHMTDFRAYNLVANLTCRRLRKAKQERSDPDLSQPSEASTQKVSMQGAASKGLRHDKREGFQTPKSLPEGEEQVYQKCQNRKVVCSSKRELLRQTTEQARST